MKLQPRYLLPATLVTTLALASCAGQDDGAAPEQAAAATSAATTTMTSTAPATTTAVPTAHALSAMEEATPVGPFTTEDVRALPAPGSELTIADVRVGSHEGFDRAVFEFTGSGTPGYVAGYNPEPLQQASGYPIDVRGDAYLELMIQGTPMGLISPDDSLVEVGPMPIAAGNIQGVTHGGVFEADSQYFIGLDEQRPYNVYVLENPTRLVVDIQK
ncbi:AMIN-like domain-containing (lipo)protein [Corynebacterium mycetoides]|nr:hypothetical protein [Corynebacterium mycetoides]